MAATYVLPTTTLPVAITGDATSVKVAAATNIVAGVWLVSNSEAMLVTAVARNETPYPVVTVIRGQGGSVATPQSASTTVYIGTPDKFYQKNPVGTPPSPALVEPYINTSLADGGVSFWTTNSGGTAWIPAPGATGGTVVGPASSTDTAVAVWNGTSGTVLKDSSVTVSSAGTVTLTTGKLTGVAFASLPAAPAAGMVAYVTDSNTVTWGATVAGSSTNKVLAFYNGTNWTVAGK